MKFKECYALCESFVDSKGKSISVGDYVQYSKLDMKGDAKVTKVSDNGITILVQLKKSPKREQFTIPKSHQGYVTIKK